MQRLILASASPRRRELLQNLGLDFDVIPSDIDEDGITESSAEILVTRLALEKACSIAKEHSEAVVIGSDTLVIKDGTILGKPKDEVEAEGMLKMLSGATHTVATGVAVVKGDRSMCDVVVTEVTFKKLEQSEIDNYIKSGDPFDKAGGYGIQGKASAMIRGIKGDYFAVMGLPVCRTVEILKEFGIEVL